MKKYKKGVGALESKYDLRTFSYIQTKANVKGGVRYSPEDIDDQDRVGICTSISMTMNAQKALGQPFSEDFQYLLQKKYIDENWNEGSSIFSALKVANKYGLLPKKLWTLTSDSDQKLSYSKYIKKLQAVTDKQIEELLKKTIKISGYAKVPVERDMLANAIDESKSGLLTRFVIGSEWWTNPVEPLRFPMKVISGHAVTTSNYNGNSFRIANSWGSDWADSGTAYYMLGDYPPTEAWIPYYSEVPPEIVEQQKSPLEKLKDILKEAIILTQEL